MKALHVVEAALFSAGRALSVEEITERTGLEAKAVQKAVQELKRAYHERDTVLEVAPAGRKWAMQVRVQAAEPAAAFARMEVSPKLLKTLALIAYHQPIKQSELSDMIGSRVYDHVPELKELGLVRTRRDGPTKILTTTPRFPEYFGLEAASPDEIRAVLAKMVGLEGARKGKGLEAFDAPPAQEGGAEDEGASGEGQDAPPGQGETGEGVEAQVEDGPSEAASDGSGARRRGPGPGAAAEEPDADKGGGSTASGGPAPAEEAPVADAAAR